MQHSVAADVKAVQSIGAVPRMLRVIAETTGVRWTAVSRVTADHVLLCAIHDGLGLGFVPGDALPIADTLCDQVRRHEQAIVIDNVNTDPAYASHRVPRLFGFQSYFSIPVYRADGVFFGTLCGLDSAPAALSGAAVLDTLHLYAELLSSQIDTRLRLSDAEEALDAERQTAELREQFIAVLGHDLRTPLSAMLSGAEAIARLTADERIRGAAQLIRRSGQRIASLVDDVMDFTRGRMGGALPVERRATSTLADTLLHVVNELQSTHAAHPIRAAIRFEADIYCDEKRIAQLLSNLLVNAIVHGQPGAPVQVAAHGGADGFVIEVGNAGKPIPPETAARLFRPFWRGDCTEQGKGTGLGLGLGLYIASEIARSHEGTLSVDSNAARTVFRFTSGRPRRP